VDVVYFETAADFRSWLEAHHTTETELWVGYHKKATGRPSITHPEAVDQALCFGWIDGVRRSVDADSYTNRFTPRTARSNWSAVNIKRVGELIELGLMTPAGLRAFEARDPSRINVYSSEQHAVALDPAYEEQLRANAAAWAFFQAQPPSYRRPAIHWVMSAKKEETRLKRLATLIDDSANGRRIGPLTRPADRAKQSSDS
jgi:uncharacterized protein YdeI (YjbR/CyaY-like superfamily)